MENIPFLCILIKKNVINEESYCVRIAQMANFMYRICRRYRKLNVVDAFFLFLLLFNDVLKSFFCFLKKNYKRNNVLLKYIYIYNKNKFVQRIITIK